MRVLVSGATGFMGRSISRHVLGAGHTVRAMSRSAEKAARKFEALPEAAAAVETGRLEFVSADVTEPASLLAAVEGVDVVIQCAQFPGAPVENARRGLTYMQVDRGGTLNLLTAISTVYRAQTAGPGMTRFPDGAPRFFYLSGVTVSQHATETWNRAKWQAESAIKGSGLEWAVVRSSWAFGPGDDSLNRILGFSDFLPFVPVFGDGTELLTPVFVEDVGRLFARLVDDPEASRDATLPLGGPEPISMNEFVGTALEVMGRRRPILHVPKPLGKIPAAVLQFLPGRPLSPGAVDFTSQGGVADLGPLLERFPDFKTTPTRAALESYLGESHERSTAGGRK
ncbi:MAG: NAD-dependent epimerase/dehydratase family protein [Actinobacteria bacterium]|nr:NAD-dependent epimerase/dehydratase family protein [Actinomycetota bacterium]